MEIFHSPLEQFLWSNHPQVHDGLHYYPLRLEHLTTISTQLQGGDFDLTDRMFPDIAAIRNGVFEDMSDLKELVPKLFFLPEILTNENSNDFTTQLGGNLDSFCFLFGLTIQ